MFFLHSMATYTVNTDSNTGAKSATITFPETTDATGRTIKPFRMYSRSSEVKFKVDDKLKDVFISSIEDDGMYFFEKGNKSKIDINTIQLGGRKSRKRKSRNKSRRYRRV